MTRRTVTIGLVIAICVQVCVLVGMQVQAALPLWTGTEVRVKTVPVDPRSLFRGNYAILRYDTDHVLPDLEAHVSDLRHGDVVYIGLAPDSEGLHNWTGASLTPPESGLYVRARVHRLMTRVLASPIGVTIPNIEAFFAPKQKALQLERDLRNGGVAVLMVAANGSVAIKDVEVLPAD